jgi:hypothetical protein
MTSGKAILLGSAVIGVAIVAAAIVWRAPLPGAQPQPVPVASMPAPAAPPPAAKPAEAPGRYQIVKVENGVSWRLDTATGEMTACRMQGDRMFCARSSEATEMPKLSQDELAARDKARKEEKTAMFDRFLAIFKWMVELAQGAEKAEKSGPPPMDRAPGDGAPRTL